LEVNNWGAAESKHAELTWGHKLPPYTVDMFDFAVKSGKSWLDLGCGFGRFLKYLDQKVFEPDYIGYDSSAAMIDRIKERFPNYAIRAFQHTITDPISHQTEVVICSAVFIHITRKEQIKVLQHISEMNPLPRAITFDINCPSRRILLELRAGTKDHTENFIRTTNESTTKFRMTWQDPCAMTDSLTGLFRNLYQITVKYYSLSGGRKKVVYFLERNESGCPE